MLKKHIKNSKTVFYCYKKILHRNLHRSRLQIPAHSEMVFIGQVHLPHRLYPVTPKMVFNAHSYTG